MNFLAFELLEHYCCVRGMNRQGVVCGVYDGRRSGDWHRWGRAQHCAPMRPDIALNRSPLRAARLLFAAPPVMFVQTLGALALSLLDGMVVGAAGVADRYGYRGMQLVIVCLIVIASSGHFIAANELQQSPCFLVSCKHDCQGRIQERLEQSGRTLEFRVHRRMRVESLVVWLRIVRKPLLQ
jgi:hypothetical protein